MPKSIHPIPHLANLICQLNNIEMSYSANGPEKSIIEAKDHVLLEESESALIEFADNDDLNAALKLIKTTRYTLNREGLNAHAIINRYRKLRKTKYKNELEAFYHAINT